MSALKAVKTEVRWIETKVILFGATIGFCSVAGVQIGCAKGNVRFVGNSYPSGGAGNEGSGKGCKTRGLPLCWEMATNLIVILRRLFLPAIRSHMPSNTPWVPPIQKASCKYLGTESVTSACFSTLLIFIYLFIYFLMLIIQYIVHRLSEFLNTSCTEWNKTEISIISSF